MKKGFKVSYLTFPRALKAKTNNSKPTRLSNERALSNYGWTSLLLRLGLFFLSKEGKAEAGDSPFLI
jgi:hypothetical protein